MTGKMEEPIYWQTNPMRSSSNKPVRASGTGTTQGSHVPPSRDCGGGRERAIQVHAAPDHTLMGYQGTQLLFRGNVIRGPYMPPGH